MIARTYISIIHTCLSLLHTIISEWKHFERCVLARYDTLLSSYNRSNEHMLCVL